MKNPQSGLPPGFRFHPTDEELILHYLRNKVASAPLPVSVISEVDIYKFDPWDLPDKAAFGEKEWYFFSPRDRKYPNGARPNRAAASGYWKATGTDKNIVASPTRTAGGHVNIGVKKALVFYKGRPPKGIKTNWIMHEYRLAQAFTHKPTNNNSSMRLDDWVLCRIYKKSNALPSATAATSDQGQEEHLIQETTVPHNSLVPQKSSSFSNLLDAIDYSILRNFLSDSHCNLSGFESAPTVSLEQPFLNSCTNMVGSNSSLPQLSSPLSVTENCLKRQHSNLNDDVFCPSKKLINSCNFSNSTTQSNIPQFNNFPNKSFFNRQFMLSPHLQFQG